jgi:hypothetical protein
VEWTRGGASCLHFNALGSAPLTANVRRQNADESMMLAHAPGLILLKALIWSLLNLLAIVVGMVAVIISWRHSPCRRSQLWWALLPLCFGVASLFWLDAIYAGVVFMCFGAVPVVCALGALVGWLTKGVRVERCAPPNGGPAERFGNSDVRGGPPSVS